MLERAAKHGTARVAAIETLGLTAFVAADHSTCRELMEDLQDLWGVTGGGCGAGAGSRPMSLYNSEGAAWTLPGAAQSHTSQQDRKVCTCR